MDIEELKSMWAEHNAKLDRVWALNVELAREQKRQAVTSQLRGQVVGGVVGMIVSIIMVVWMGLHAAAHSTPLSAAIPAIVVAALSFSAMIGSASQLALLRRIDPTQSVVRDQRSVLQLRSMKTKFNRFVLFASYFFIWSFVFVLLGLDPVVVIAHVWAAAPVVVLVHGGMGVLWIPFCVWLLGRYDSKGLGKTMARLRDESGLTENSVSPTLNRVLAQLEELRRFEESDDVVAGER